MFFTSSVMSFFKKEKIIPEIEDAIKQELSRIRSRDSFGWAVRSSAIGEDSEELSAAGQNDTFLGCLTEEQVLKSVAACWASLFSYQSVQYRWYVIMTQIPIRDKFLWKIYCRMFT